MAIETIEPGDGGVGYSWFAVEVVSYEVHPYVSGEATAAIFKFYRANPIIIRRNKGIAGLLRRNGGLSIWFKKYRGKFNIFKQGDGDSSWFKF